MLTSSICFVDIFESQISNINISAGRRWHVKSHMIQITSLDESVYKVEVWSNIYFKIKVDKNFLRSLRKGVFFTLHTAIEDANMRVMYESDFNKAKLQLSSNTVIGYNGSKSLVMIDPYKQCPLIRCSQ